jgi:hypothetical protein
VRLVGEVPNDADEFRHPLRALVQLTDQRRRIRHDALGRHESLDLRWPRWPGVRKRVLPSDRWRPPLHPASRAMAEVDRYRSSAPERLSVASSAFLRDSLVDV